jgi:D-ribose pyranose/furanose isomerase RbsD
MPDTIEMPKKVQDVRFETLNALAKGKGFIIEAGEISNWKNFISKKMHKETNKRFRVTTDLKGNPIAGRIK